MRSARPAKANPPSIVDADGVLLHAIALQLLQPIRRRLPQVFEFFRGIDDYEFLEGATLHIGRDLPYSGAGLARPKICRSGVREAVNHASMKVAASSIPGKGDFHPFREHTNIAAIGKAIGQMGQHEVIVSGMR